ncbi:MAG: hydrogenase maturation nickel metallochaperone HypA/HybF [Burkholderiales bacterium]
MHEMALAEGVLQVIEDAAVSQGFERVVEVHLEVGALAGVEVEALRFCMDAVLAGSIATGARVELSVTPGHGFCLSCAETVPMSVLFDACPQCGSYQVQATDGTEMRVKDLLVQ